VGPRVGDLLGTLDGIFVGDIEGEEVTAVGIGVATGAGVGVMVAASRKKELIRNDCVKSLPPIYTLKPPLTGKAEYEQDWMKSVEKREDWK